MDNGFWDNLPDPFYGLAPMEDVTDVAFRQMFARYGRYEEGDQMRGPDVMWTEFTSADGLVKGGWKRLKHQLKYQENERPIVAQLFSAHPGRMRQAAAICYQLGFDGVDINMCCPSETVVGNDCGSALIKTPKLAQKLIKAAREGAGGLPVSVKTRTGFDEHRIKTWISTLLETHIAALSLHARTRKQMSKVPADWSTVEQTREIRDQMNKDTLIIGNGDVESLTEAKNRAGETGVEGIMVGRGAFGNPWFFNLDITRAKLPKKKRLSVMVEHAKTFDELLPDQHFAIMRKHFKAYTKGLPHANDLRNNLMQTADSAEVKEVVMNYLHGLK
ncbi:MAG: tRNA-dihydrouridine synthase [Parcubacteria group bacterium SW_6_46_9]|nr:MAG: tRNA-dihydrouridine synthase [Parcubacteria group bacterium SW_6_46_9]